MTEREANELVGRRLVFGNEDQIRAVRFLAELADARKAAMECRRAPYKSGIAPCRCVKNYSEEILAQLKLDQKRGRIQ